MQARAWMDGFFVLVAIIATLVSAATLVLFIIWRVTPMRCFSQ